MSKTNYTIKTYEIKVYAGFSDWDQGDKYDLEEVIEISSLFTKQDIKNMLFAKYKDYRVVVIGVNEIN